MNKEELMKTLKENRLWAQKRLGQNFLINCQPIETIIKNSNLSSQDTVVEIGPGLGILTEALAPKAKLVLAIEKDFKLVEFLRKKFKSEKNVKIIHDDILAYDLRLVTQKYKVIANLPYNITSPTIRKFLEAENKPQEMILMVQKEVAERICAKPGDSNRGVLTIMIEFYSDAEIIGIVKRDNFFPVPKVDSAIIKLKVKGQMLKVDDKVFFSIVKAGFSQKRRQIHNSLEATLRLPSGGILAILKEAKIAPTLRAEDLNLVDWINLYEKVQERI